MYIARASESSHMSPYDGTSPAQRIVNAPSQQIGVHDQQCLARIDGAILVSGARTPCLWPKGLWLASIGADNASQSCEGQETTYGRAQRQKAMKSRSTASSLQRGARGAFCMTGSRCGRIHAGTAGSTAEVAGFALRSATRHETAYLDWLLSTLPPVHGNVFALVHVRILARSG